MVEPKASRLLPAGPVARRVHVEAKWLRAEADAGRLPHLKAGNRYLFDPEVVEQILWERVTQTVPVQANVQVEGGDDGDT